MTKNSGIVDDRLNRMEDMLTQLITIVGKSNGKIDLLAETVHHLDEKVNLLADKVDRLADSVETLSQRIDKLEHRIGKLEQRVDRLEDRIRKLEDRISKLENRVGKLEHRMDRLEREVASFRLETSERFDRLEKAIEFSDYRLRVHRDKIAENSEEIEVLKKAYWSRDWNKESA